MKLKVSEYTPPANHETDAIHNIYSRYGGMLLGYLIDLIKDRQAAEEYVIKVFRDLPGRIDEVLRSRQSIWVQLQVMAKAKLAPVSKTITDCKDFESGIQDKWIAAGSRLAQLSPEQRRVFCGIYYHHKTAVVLAAESGTTEREVMKIVKEVFTIMRNGG